MHIPALIRLRSTIAAVLLKNLDLVPVGVRDEKELRHECPVAMELFDWSRRKALALEACVLVGEIVDSESDVPVAVAQLVGLPSVVVNGQLELEIRFVVAQVNERESFERETVCDLEAEGAGVEVDRSVLVEHADHGVDRFRHGGLRS